MKSGRIEPVAIIKSGQTIKYEDFVKATANSSTPAVAATLPGKK
jgi:hypothetical protein